MTNMVWFKTYLGDVEVFVLSINENIQKNIHISISFTRHYNIKAMWTN